MPHSERFDREQAAKEFNDLCDEAHAAIDRVGTAAEQFQADYAAQHGVDPSQVEVWISGTSPDFIPVIRPPRPH